MPLSSGDRFSIQMGLSAMDSFGDAQFASGGAKTAEKNARIARVRGEFKEKDFRRQATRIAGTQVAVLAANGVDISGGSALDFLADQAFESEMIALEIRMGAEQQAQAFEQQAEDLRAQERKAKKRGALQLGLSIGAAFFTGGASLAVSAGAGVGAAAASR